jgi:hypothetical protein
MKMAVEPAMYAPAHFCVVDVSQHNASLRGKAFAQGKAGNQSGQDMV